MYNAKLLAEATELARRLDYTVREEYLEGAGGGHCTFGGQKWLLLDVTQSVDEQLSDVADALRDGRALFGTVDSWLIWRLTGGITGGVHVTDVTNASRTLLFDLQQGDWSDELCQLFGVPRDALPDLVPSWGEIAPTEPSVFLPYGEGAAARFAAVLAARLSG